jgi:hypothetical protein
MAGGVLGRLWLVLGLRLVGRSGVVAGCGGLGMVALVRALLLVVVVAEVVPAAVEVVCGGEAWPLLAGLVLAGGSWCSALCRALCRLMEGEAASLSRGDSDGLCSARMIPQCCYHVSGKSVAALLGCASGGRSRNRSG